MIEECTLRTGRFYRVGETVLYCVRYTWTQGYDQAGYHAKKAVIDIDGIVPQDYAAYVLHHIIDQQNPNCTIADRECIPMPTYIRIHCTSEDHIEEISNEKALASGGKE